MNVFESQLGNDFVAQLMPRLVTAVEKIAEQLSAETHYPPIPLQMRKDVLHELFTGHFCPGDEAGCTQTSRYRNLTMTLQGLETEIKQQISEEHWKAVEQYCTAFAERDAEEMKICFEAGYRAATQLLVAGLTISEGAQEDEV